MVIDQKGTYQAKAEEKKKRNHEGKEEHAWTRTQVHLSNVQEKRETDWAERVDATARTSCLTWDTTQKSVGHVEENAG